MKRSLPVKSILTGIALALAGCDTAETKPEAEHEAKSEVTAPKPGPAAPPGPVQPAPEPHLPATTKYDPKQDEAKPEPKKEEPKAETPK